ncbi:hypothetical protein FAM22277_02884 [Lacticaseibacillus paracasei]|nr:hypothetical protein FAM22277_02884 [Lacticaseibacillus paracasei]
MSKRLKITPPRIYKREAHKVWTAFSCKPRRWSKETRMQIKEQLQYIRQDLRYVSELTDQGATLVSDELVPTI